VYRFDEGFFFSFCIEDPISSEIIYLLGAHMQKGIFSVIGMLTISMGCASHRLTKNADIPSRELASFSRFRPTQVNSSNTPVHRAAVTLVGPRGDVIYFMKVRENILIKQCEHHSVVQKQEDCQPKEGTQVREVPVEQFKSHLRNSLLVSSFELSNSQDREKLDAFREASRNADKDAGFNPEQLRADRQRIENFIKFYCGVQKVDLESDCARQNADVAHLKDVISTLDRIRKREEAINEINTIINRLVDEVIGRDEITIYRFSDDSETLAYQILRSYVRPLNPEMEFVRIREGQFDIRHRNRINRYNDEPPVSVRISRDFEMQKTEITQLQWWTVMGTKPSHFSSQQFCPDSWSPEVGCPYHPVENISWNEVQDFITKLNSQDPRYSYRLPTEAEWEYATRAGTPSAYFFGNDEKRATDYAWVSENSGFQTRQVATKKANPWGLHDVYGNVWEWVQDWYNNSRVGGTDPTGPSSGSSRVVRGGCWLSDASSLRLEDSNGGAGPGIRSRLLGARLVRTAK
jgi:formylglycine-generating enzyme required for sulfatase activity